MKLTEVIRLNILVILNLTLIFIGCDNSKHDKAYYLDNIEKAEAKLKECETEFKVAAASQSEAKFREVIANEECRYSQEAIFTKRNEAAELKRKTEEDKIKAEEELLASLSDDELVEKLTGKNSLKDFGKFSIIQNAINKKAAKLEESYLLNKEALAQASSECDTMLAGQSYEGKRKVQNRPSCIAAKSAEDKLKSQEEENKRKESEKIKEAKISEFLKLPLSEFEDVYNQVLNKTFFRDIPDMHKDIMRKLEIEEAIKRRLEIEALLYKENIENLKKDINNCIREFKAKWDRNKFMEARKIESSLRCAIATEGAKRYLGFKGNTGLPRDLL